MTTARRLPLTLAVVFGLQACAQVPAARSISQAPPANVTVLNPQPLAAGPRRHVKHAVLGKGKIQHVVIIFQENRSTDTLFNGLKGADTVTYGYNTVGEKVRLQSISLTAPWDVAHSHVAFITAFDGGRMDGFNLETSSCALIHKPCTLAADQRAYTFVRHSEIQPYFDMAEQYAFGDKMFATQAGPSFPAHQYLVSAADTVTQSSTLRASENPLAATQKFTGGCDSPPGTLVTLIDANGAEDQAVYPCFDRPSLTDLVDAQKLTWRYYQYKVGPGLWNGLDAIKHVRYGSEYSRDVVSPPSQVLTDIANGNLANVVWVTPTAKASDHPGSTNGTGPSWVASVVNAIGESKYWDSTAIFVTWDDWGGFYDHVTPPQYNSYELGFRVPLVVIGPYAKQGYVSHVQHEFGSMLKFTEEVFDLGSLGATDERADDLSDCFNFNRKPRAFIPIKAPLGARYFLKRPPDNERPDDE